MGKKKKNYHPDLLKKVTPFGTFTIKSSETVIDLLSQCVSLLGGPVPTLQFACCETCKQRHGFQGFQSVSWYI